MVGVYTFKRFVCLVALVSVEAVTAAQTADATSGSPSHVVVIPDVHGDRDAFIQSLWLGSLAVGESGIAFTQFNSTFYDTFTSSSSPQRLSSRTDVAMVQLGDLIDRGPFSVDCITIASVVSQVLGWQTTRLIGNHETMAMAGLFDAYVHPAEMLSFAGAAARQAAFAPGGIFHNHISTHFAGMWRLANAAGKGTLFVHAGLETDWLWWNAEFDFENPSAGQVDTVNRAIREMMNDAEELEHLNTERSSCVWSRFMAEAADANVCGEYLEELLSAFEVDRIVVGHTPQFSGFVKTRCGGRILLADVAMSRWMRRSRIPRPVAIVFDQYSGELVRIVAHYSENERQLLLDRNEPVELVEDDGFVPIAPLVGDTPNVAWQDESGDEESLVSITLDQDDSDIDWNDFLLHIHHHPEAGRQT